LKKIALKYLTGAVALIFISASSYCAVEALAETLAHLGASHHHHDDGEEPHDHAAPAPSQGHHHGDSSSPVDNGQSADFCCSQLNGIPSQWHSATLPAKNLFFAATVHIPEQISNPAPRATQRWLLHDKAPPGLHSTLFYDLNFSSHAPPLSLSC